MTDKFNLNRFVTAQDGSYTQALAELQQGRKVGHWIWFIFPQHVALGRSATAIFYGIRSTEEARGYLRHETLGPRLLEASAALLRHAGAAPERIMGDTDALKLKSSMTLFEAVADDPLPFAAVIEAFFAGVRDRATLRLIAN